MLCRIAIQFSIGTSSPLYVHYISNCLCVVQFVVCFDCLNCTCYIYCATRVQCRQSTWDCSQQILCHYLRSYGWSNHEGIDAIACQISNHSIVPCLARCNQRTDNMFLACNRIFIYITIANRTCDSCVFVATLNSSSQFTCSGDVYIYIIYCTCHIQIILCNDSSFLSICTDCVWFFGSPWVCWTFYTVFYTDSVIFRTVLY